MPTIFVKKEIEKKEWYIPFNYHIQCHPSKRWFNPYKEFFHFFSEEEISNFKKIIIDPNITSTSNDPNNLSMFSKLKQYNLKYAVSWHKIYPLILIDGYSGIARNKIQNNIERIKKRSSSSFKLYIYSYTKNKGEYYTFGYDGQIYVSPDWGNVLDENLIDYKKLEKDIRDLDKEKNLNKEFFLSDHFTVRLLEDKHSIAFYNKIIIRPHSIPRSKYPHVENPEYVSEFKILWGLMSFRSIKGSLKDIKS